MFSKRCSLIALAIAPMVCIGSMTPAAMADPSTTSPSSTVALEVANSDDFNSTPEEIAQIQGDAAADATDIRQSVVGGRMLTEYDVEGADGLRATVVTNEPDPDAIQPRMRAGVGWGLYLYLNKSEQEALFTGGAAGIAAAACALPALGALSCGAIAAALGVAVTWLNNNGLCDNELEIRLPVTRLKCV